mgnify:CR=1 FL=1
MRWFVLALLVLLPVAAQAADDPAARKLLDDVAAKNAAGFQTGQSKTAITLRLANGKEKTWLTLARAARFGGKLRTRVTFLEPAEDRGVELLMLEEQKGRTAQYLWLPKMRRLRPVGGSQKSQPFMGTDFSFGDLEGAGLVARRIRCDVRAGQQLLTGQRFGMIRFGSRLDVYLPPGVAPLVCVGQHAVAGETVIADLASSEPQREGEVR